MPSATKVLLILNIGVFLILNPLLPDLFYDFALVPAAFSSGSYWQPLTSMFLHDGLPHIAMNMIGLWSIGTLIENRIGTRKFISLYMISGLSGALSIILFSGNPQGHTVGASGAVLGLLGALAVFFPNSMLLLFFIPMKARTAALLFGSASLLAVYFDFFPIMSHSGHLGGLIGGLIYARFAIPKPRKEVSGEPFSQGQTANSNQVDPYSGSTRNAFNQFIRNPRSKTFWGGHFTEPEEKDSEQKKSPDRVEVEIERPKRLHYDRTTGTFFFK